MDHASGPTNLTPGAFGPTDAELVAAHLSGDRTALAAIYDRYADRLHDTAAGMLSDRHEAADVTHDVFVIAAQRLDQLRDPALLRAWLFAVLRHEVYRRSRRRRRQRVVDAQAPELNEMTAAADPASEGAAVDAARLGELVRQAAAGLDDRDQLVLELTARQELSGAELAAVLGVSVAQTHVIVHRMRERVERSLGALVVARVGRRECDELTRLLRGWDGHFDALIRKRVARHVEQCPTCERTKRKFAVVPMFSAAPALAAPISLRDRVLRSVEQGATGDVAHRVEFSAPGGFPAAAEPRRRTGLLAAATAVGLSVLAFAVVAGPRVLTGFEATSPTSPMVSPIEADTTVPAVVGEPRAGSTTMFPADTTRLAPGIPPVARHRFARTDADEGTEPCT